MSTISTTQFLKVADRLSAQYEAILDLSTQLSPPENQASLRVGTLTRAMGTITGASSSFRVRAKSYGDAGNSISVELRINSVTNQELSAQLFDDRLIILLGTDGSAICTTTLSAVADLLRSYKPFQDVIEVLADPGYVISGLAVENTFNLTGGLSDDVFTIKAKTPGKEGNDLTFQIAYQIGSNVAANLEITENKHLIVNSAQSSGSPNTTPADIKNMVEADYQANELFEVTLYSDGTTISSELEQTNLTGGMNGPYSSTVLSEPPGSIVCQADPDVALLISAAQPADVGLTAAAFVKGVVVLENLEAALANHMSRTGAQSIQSYLTENALYVHESFSILNGIRTGVNLKAVNVFKKISVHLGDIDLSGSTLAAVTTPDITLGLGSGDHSSTNHAGQFLEAKITPALTRAALTISPSGTHNDLVFTAVHGGEEGNRIFVKYTNPAAANQNLGVVVTTTAAGKHINVNLATNGSSVITTTASLIIATIAASQAASNLVNVALVSGNDGTGVVTAISETPLAGGVGPNLVNNLKLTLTLKDEASNSVTLTNLRFNAKDTPGTTVELVQRAFLTTPVNINLDDQLYIYAKDGGTAGNDITITFLDPAANNQVLGTSNDNDSSIVVNLATGAGGAITSTASQVRDLLLGDSFALTLIGVDLVGTGSGVVDPLAATNLSGGLDTKRYISIQGATLVSGGTSGDKISIYSKVEREVTL